MLLYALLYATTLLDQWTIFPAGNLVKMKILYLLPLLAMVCLCGCQAAEEEPSTGGSESATSKASESTDTSTAIEAGMEMADVKKIKGAPDHTRHEHGDEGAEIDIWVYGSEEIRFVDGKVEE